MYVLYIRTYIYTSCFCQGANADQFDWFDERFQFNQTGKRFWRENLHHWPTLKNMSVPKERTFSTFIVSASKVSGVAMIFFRKLKWWLWLWHGGVRPLYCIPFVVQIDKLKDLPFDKLKECTINIHKSNLPRSITLQWKLGSFPKAIEFTFQGGGCCCIAILRWGSMA